MICWVGLVGDFLGDILGDFSLFSGFCGGFLGGSFSEAVQTVCKPGSVP